MWVFMLRIDCFSHWINIPIVYIYSHLFCSIIEYTNFRVIINIICICIYKIDILLTYLRLTARTWSNRAGRFICRYICKYVNCWRTTGANLFRSLLRQNKEKLRLHWSYNTLPSFKFSNKQLIFIGQFLRQLYAIEM